MTHPERRRELELAEVARLTGGALHGPPDLGLRGLTHDSRRVQPGMLFCALPGLERDGSMFVADALARGAAAVLGPTAPPSPAPWVEVADARRALGPLAQRFHGDPSAEVVVVGITGTNGKTTTSFLAAAVLEEALGSAAALGTLGLRRGGRTLATGFTTPEAPELAALLRSLADDGVRSLAMEVSSHALDQHRVDGVRFQAGVFTNLTHEHLDYHRTLEDYLAAKLGLFDILREQDAWGVVNLDDPAANAFLARAPRRVLTYAQERPGADVFAREVALEGPRSRVRATVRGERLELRVPLGGRFNVSNALAALAVGVALGLAPRRAAEALARVERVPGRFEVYTGGGRTVLIDYAHTPDAFERVLAAARQLAPGRLVLIFGCGGERDREKRPLMGELAAELADRVFLTMDNPRREPLDRIAADVSAGLARGRAPWMRLDDRAEAIRRALRESRPGDLVVLLGKGDEGYQDVNGVKHPHSDRDLARRELAALEASERDDDWAPGADRAERAGGAFDAHARPGPAGDARSPAGVSVPGAPDGGLHD
jgi:UDP-N-acetylmuramoyl-L-alanyl-D-glutamate--2,6-diaminopimelate ligase